MDYLTQIKSFLTAITALLIIATSPTTPQAIKDSATSILTATSTQMIMQSAVNYLANVPETSIPTYPAPTQNLGQATTSSAIAATTTQQITFTDTTPTATPSTTTPITTTTTPQITMPTQKDIGDPFNDKNFGYSITYSPNEATGNQNVMFWFQPNTNDGWSDNDNLTSKIEVTIDGQTESGKMAKFISLPVGTHSFSLKYIRGNNFGTFTGTIDIAKNK